MKEAINECPASHVQPASEKLTCVEVAKQILVRRRVPLSAVETSMFAAEEIKEPHFVRSLEELAQPGVDFDRVDCEGKALSITKP